ncbi:hypothetical protein Q7C36_007482 [Tachysurus vachellii]|uniref:Uncharacterized protein n=1 Tax=Tachysurus vachellii TaxID=175792 RepID=A0AA88N8R9_TACVA|nr:hypothetical protein Q7C36_007482 [Tachysurus vachellii]
MHKKSVFCPGCIKVVFRKGPLGYLLQDSTEEARVIKDNPALQDKSAPKKEELVRQNALAVVRQRGGDASDKREVLGEYILQFGKYKGKSFRWLLENDMGYTICLIKNLQQEEAMGVFTSEGPSKSSLLSFSNYACSFNEIQSLLSYVSKNPGLVGFGAHAKSTWQEIWNRADGYASFILWATCVPGTRMYKLQQYLRNQMQSARPQLLSQRVSLFFASVKELFAVHGSLLQEPSASSIGNACTKKAVGPQAGSKAGCALAANRTRASRVAGENSTTEPPMPMLRGRGHLRQRWPALLMHGSLLQEPSPSSIGNACTKKAVGPQAGSKAVCALAGNRNWASRVAGEKSTTEPPMPTWTPSAEVAGTFNGSFQATPVLYLTRFIFSYCGSDLLNSTALWSTIPKAATAVRRSCGCLPCHRFDPSYLFLL